MKNIYFELGYIAAIGAFAGAPLGKKMMPITALFVVTVSLIDRVITPYFVYWFDSYRHITLMNFLTNISHLTVSILVAKTICYLAGLHLSFKQIRNLGILFIPSYYLMKATIKTFREIHETATDRTP